MKKRLLALTLVAALFIGLLAGCGNNANKPSDTNTPSDTNQPADTDKTNEPSKDAKGEVYYLNFKPEQNDAWQALAKAYTEETGVPVTVVTAASGTYEETLMSEIAKSNPPTLFQVNGPVGLANWKDYCLDLNGSAILGELTSEDFALKDRTPCWASPTSSSPTASSPTRPCSSRPATLWMTSRASPI